MKKYYYYGLAIFIVSRVVYYLLGITFDSSSLPFFWQYIDPLLLKTDLLKSLYYLHSQPPFYNLYLGVVLKVFGSFSPYVFYTVNLILGLAIYYLIYSIQIKLKISEKIAFTLSTIFMISPATMLFESWLFYSYIVTFLLLLSVYLFQCIVDDEKKITLIFFFSALFLLGATRSLFHYLYYMVATGAVLYFSKNRKRVLIIAVVPFILLLSLYMKNYIVFNKFGLSSWLGMNMFRSTTHQVSMSKRADLMKKGKLSDVALIYRFSKLEKYPDHYKANNPYGDAKVLTDVNKSTDQPNYNHFAFIKISESYLKDAIYSLLHYPHRYLVGYAMSWFEYFKPASNYHIFEKRTKKIETLKNTFQTIFYGKLPKVKLLNSRRNLHIFLIIGLPFLFLYGVKRSVGRSIKDKTIFYITLNILLITAVVNFLECGENHRMRYVIDPLFIILIGLFVSSNIQSVGNLFKRITRGKNV